MMFKVYAIYDKGAECFLQPFVARAHGEASRMFMDGLTHNDSPMKLHPQDYDLYEIGTFDSESGLVSQLMEDGKLIIPRVLTRGSTSVN